MRKKGNISTVFLVMILLIGLSLLLYPSISNWWNSRVQTRIVSNYAEAVANMSENYDSLWEAVYSYNESLISRENPYLLSEDQQQKYTTLLNASGTGIMSVIEIPSINVYLPVYHGTSESVLSVAIGHLEWTSLPAGGESTHCVVSGHRGLPSARLFTDLDKLKIGDVFMMHVLEKTLTYEIDQIHIVEPHETEDLFIQEGKDLCTLVTCTPYGVNSHRLLIRGHRVENIAEAQNVRVTADAMVVEKLVVAPFLLVPLLMLMLLWVMIPRHKK